MAKIQVQINSKDMIKPLSPTPNHLKTVKLSCLDQFAPPVYMSLIFFYQTPLSHNNNSQTTTAMLLKNSLSQTLVQFYPLAGRVQGNLTINCNDQGVEFYEADVLTSLAEVIAIPNPHDLTRLLPFAPLSCNKGLVTAVQLNRFSCGSIAISVSLLHKVVDAATSLVFINAWARNSQEGVSKEEHPKLAIFDSATFFPPMDLNGIYDPESIICKEKLVTRRLIFNKEKLDKLKKQCDDGQLESPPTRVGVVSAFFWKKFIKIARAKPTPPKIVCVTQVINLRTMKSSPIPKNYHGNLALCTYAATPIEPEIEYTEAVSKIRMSLKKIDKSYLTKIKTGECFLEFQNGSEGISQGEVEYCGVSSLVSFPLYEVDFGCGAPIWLSVATLPFKNSIYLLPTKCGQGIEAWMNVLEHDAAALEDDHEFRSLAS